MDNANKAESKLRREIGGLQERALELDSAAEQRDRWITDNAPAIRRRFALEREMWWREQQGALRAEVMMPSYLRDHVGPRPERPSERGAWHAAVRAVESYRERWGVTDIDDALGHGRVSRTQEQEREAVSASLERPAVASKDERDMGVALERSREL